MNDIKVNFIQKAMIYLVLIRRPCQGLHNNILTPIRLLAPSSSNEWPLFFNDDLVTSDCQRLQAVRSRCRRGRVYSLTFDVVPLRFQRQIE